MRTARSLTDRISCYQARGGKGACMPPRAHSPPPAMHAPWHAPPPSAMHTPWAVGCVLPAHWLTISCGIRPGGVGVHACPPGTQPPRSCMLPGMHPHHRPCTPPGHACPPIMHTPQPRTPPGMHAPHHACPPSCTLWTEWQTGVKILPCPKLLLRAVITF